DFGGGGFSKCGSGKSARKVREGTSHDCANWPPTQKSVCTILRFFTEFIRRLKVSRVSAVIVMEQIVLFCHAVLAFQKKQMAQRHSAGPAAVWFVCVRELSASLPSTLMVLNSGLPR